MYRTKGKGKFKYWILKKISHMEKLQSRVEYARIKYAKRRQQCIEKNLFSNLYNNNKSYALESWRVRAQRFSKLNIQRLRS
jgi:hypothetical protein